MNGPHPALTRRYGNEHIFLQKEAGSVSLAARVAMGLITAESVRRFYDTLERGRQQSEMRARGLQMEDVPMMRQMTRHHAVPIFVGANLPVGGQPMGLSPDIPLGMDEGMVRMASIMADVGAEMAKEGIAPIQAMKGFLTPSTVKMVSQVKPGAIPSSQAAHSVMSAAPKAVKIGPGVNAGHVNAASPAGAVNTPVGHVQPAGDYRQSAAPVPNAAATKITDPTITPPKPEAPPGEKPPNALVEGAKSVGKGVGTAAALGIGAAGLGLYGLTRGAAGIMSQENQPSDWGGANYGASQPVYGVNQYGYAQRGSPFVY